MVAVLNTRGEVVTVKRSMAVAVGMAKAVEETVDRSQPLDYKLSASAALRAAAGTQLAHMECALPVADRCNVAGRCTGVGRSCLWIELNTSWQTAMGCTLEALELAVIVPGIDVDILTALDLLSHIAA